MRRWGHVTKEAVQALDTVYRARDLARRLRGAKSDHPWSPLECDLLAKLCDVLGVEEDGRERRAS